VTCDDGATQRVSRAFSFPCHPVVSRPFSVVDGTPTGPLTQSCGYQRRHNGRKFGLSQTPTSRSDSPRPTPGAAARRPSGRGHTQSAPRLTALCGGPSESRTIGTGESRTIGTGGASGVRPIRPRRQRLKALGFARSMREDSRRSPHRCA
jgi:hypothetical protein